MPEIVTASTSCTALSYLGRVPSRLVNVVVARRTLRRRFSELRHLPSTPRALWASMVTRGFVSRAEAELLYRLASRVSEGVIVEVGSYRGRSTVALARGARAGSAVAVYAVDPHEAFQDHPGSPQFGPPDRAAFFRAMLRSRCYHQVRLVNLSSEEVTPGWRRPVGLLWIDGDHSAEAVRRDLECWWPHLLPGAAVAFDDAVGPGSGPAAVIAENVAAGRLSPRRSVGKVAVLDVVGADSRC